MRKLKILPAEIWHDSPYIIGNKEALDYLIDAITMAIHKQDIKASTSAEMFESDGEGFDVKVIEVSDENFDKFPVHYSDNIASEKDHIRWKFFVEYISKLLPF